MKTVYSILFLIVAALMAILFGPIGLLPMMIIFVKKLNLQENIDTENGVNAAKKIDLFLLFIFVLTLSTWYSLKYFFEKWTLYNFLFKICELSIIKTATINSFMSKKNVDFVDYIGVNLLSIISLFLIFSILFLFRYNFASLFLNWRYKAINRNYKNKNSNLIVYIIALLFDIIPYLTESLSDFDKNAFINIKSVIYNSTIFPGAILFNLLAIVIWTRGPTNFRGQNQ